MVRSPSKASRLAWHHSGLRVETVVVGPVTVVQALCDWALNCRSLANGMGSCTIWPVSNLQTLRRQIDISESDSKSVPSNHFLKQATCLG